jgi:hypothetical protein
VKRVEEHVGTPGPVQDDGEAITFHSIYEMVPRGNRLIRARLLRGQPASEHPLVFTKCGLVWDERNPMAEPRRVLKPESIWRECDASLRRLGALPLP